MKVEDDLKLHSHYIEDLFKHKEETVENIGVIKETIGELKEKIGLHAYAHSVQDQNIVKCISCNAEMAKKIEDTNKVIDALNANVNSKFYFYEFMKGILNSPRNWALTIGFIFTVEITVGLSEVLKHFLRLS